MLLEENPTSLILQGIIIVLASVIIVMLYMERSTTSTIRQAITDFEVPSCPSCPKCPDCNHEGCPDCVCPESNSGSCPACPKCPDVNTSCPSQNITVEEIVDAIFPGRNQGITTHGEYYPLTGMDEMSVQSAYSPVLNMVPNAVGGDGIPAAISFQDQKLLNSKGMIGLASQKNPPIVTTQGVFSDNLSTSSASAISTPTSTPTSTSGPTSTS